MDHGGIVETSNSPLRTVRVQADRMVGMLNVVLSCRRNHHGTACMFSP